MLGQEHGVCILQLLHHISKLRMLTFMLMIRANFSFLTRKMAMSYMNPEGKHNMQRSLPDKVSISACLGEGVSVKRFLARTRFRMSCIFMNDRYRSSMCGRRSTVSFLLAKKRNFKNENIQYRHA